MLFKKNCRVMLKKCSRGDKGCSFCENVKQANNVVK